MLQVVLLNSLVHIVYYTVVILDTIYYTVYFIQSTLKGGHQSAESKYLSSEGHGRLVVKHSLSVHQKHGYSTPVVYLVNKRL
jgi:hypothetical protein